MQESVCESGEPGTRKEVSVSLGRLGACKRASVSLVGLCEVSHCARFARAGGDHDSAQLWTNVGTMWDQLVANLGPMWTNLGPIWDQFGNMLGTVFGERKRAF